MMRTRKKYVSLSLKHWISSSSNSLSRCKMIESTLQRDSIFNDHVKIITFVQGIVIVANSFNLGLNSEQLICLWRECLELSTYYSLIDFMILSNVKLFWLSSVLSRYHDSLFYLKKILPVVEKCRNSRYQVFIYRHLTMTYTQLEQYDNAVSHAQKMVEIAEDLDDKLVKKNVYSFLASTYLPLGRYSEMILFSKKYLEIEKETDAKDVEANTYLFMAIASVELCQYDDAILYAKKYEHFAKKNVNKLLETTAYLCLGATYLKQNRPQDCVSYCKKSIAVAKESSDYTYSYEMQAHLILVYSHEKLCQFKDAELHCRKYLDFAKKLGNKSAEALGYSLLGQSLFNMNMYDDAISYSRKCIDMEALNVVENIDLDLAYLILGRASVSLNKSKDAVLYFKKCIENAKVAGDVNSEMKAYLYLGGGITNMMIKYDDVVMYNMAYTSLNTEVGKEIESKGEKKPKKNSNLSGSHPSSSQYTCGLVYLKKCHDIAKRIGNMYYEMGAHEMLSQVYMFICQLEKSYFHAQEGMVIAKELRDNDAKMKFTKHINHIYYFVGMHDKCEVSDGLLDTAACAVNEEQLLSALDKANDITRRMSLRFRLHCFYDSTQQYDKAIENLQQVKELRLHTYMYLQCNLEIVEYYKLLKQNDKALKVCLDELPVAKTSEHKLTQAMYYSSIVELYSIYGKFILAGEYLKEAIKCFEIAFGNLGCHDNFKISIVDNYVSCYTKLSWILLVTDEREEALLVLDCCRARALKDLLSTNLRVKEESDEEILVYAHITSLVETYSIVFYSVADKHLLTFLIDDKVELLLTNKFLNMNVKDLDQLVDRSFEEMEVRDVVNCENRSLDSEQEVKNNPKASCLMSLTSSQKEKFLNFDYELDLSDISDASVIRMLYKIVVGEMIHILSTDEVVFIPDGPLYKLPFAALRDPDTGRYLSEMKRIRLAPSLSALKFLSDHSEDHHRKDALIIGDPLVGKVMMDGKEREFPRLIGAREEAADIALILMVPPLLSQEATKPAVLRKLQKGVSVVHIAAHGSLERAAIVLAPSKEVRATKIPDEEDYMLTMADVQKAQVRAQLVVLSCCHSGRGEIRTEGVVGMCRAFLASGARAVVASLWAIDDEATLEFMTHFYTHLKERKSASTSLQLTMDDMRKSQRFSKPKYWAPFFLMGDDVTIDVTLQ